jgi:hypothetical protein
MEIKIRCSQTCIKIPIFEIIPRQNDTNLNLDIFKRNLAQFPKFLLSNFFYGSDKVFF